MDNINQTPQAIETEKSLPIKKKSVVKKNFFGGTDLKKAFVIGEILSKPKSKRGFYK